MSEIPNIASSTEDFEFGALQEAVNYRAALLREFGPYLDGAVLEVGAGIGQFSTELKRLPRVTRLLSVEPDPGFAGKFRAAHPEFELIEGVASSVPAGSAWNAIFCINVLEHIEQDARELEQFRSLLAGQAGHLCLFVPARQEIYAPIDRDFGHFRRYDAAGLRRKLESAGFEVRRLRYYNWVGYFAWWLTFRVMKKRHFDRASVRLFDRVIFPAVHAMETRVAAPPFGQSLLAVCRARA